MFLLSLAWKPEANQQNPLWPSHRSKNRTIKSIGCKNRTIKSIRCKNRTIKSIRCKNRTIKSIGCKNRTIKSIRCKNRKSCDQSHKTQLLLFWVFFFPTVLLLDFAHSSQLHPSSTWSYILQTRSDELDALQLLPMKTSHSPWQGHVGCQWRPTGPEHEWWTH